MEKFIYTEENPLRVFTDSPDMIHNVWPWIGWVFLMYL